MSASPTGARTLLIDDDAIFTGVLARALNKRGFVIETALAYQDALIAIDNGRHDFAVVDLKMPDGSGLALVERLRLRNPGIRIVVLTGYASVATAVEAIKLGATHYLPKPADADEIVAAFGRDQGDAGAPLNSQPISVDRLEWEHIQRVLSEHTGNVSATARALNMHRRTLQRKLGKKPSRG
jgi:two-component system, response regulator RegA